MYQGYVYVCVFKSPYLLELESKKLQLKYVFWKFASKLTQRWWECRDVDKTRLIVNW